MVHETVHELTLREAEVLALLAAGYTNKGIGERLHLVEYSVNRCLSDIYQKLQPPAGMNPRVWTTLYVHGLDIHHAHIKGDG